MRFTRFAALATTACLAALPGTVQAAESVCLTAREFTALSTYALPSAIEGTTRTCTPLLGNAGWLPRNGTALAQRYSAGKARAWPEAKGAFLKMSTATNPDAARLFQQLPDESLRPLADAALAGIVSAELKPDSCQTVDRVLALISPLPAESAAELIALATGLAAKRGGDGGMRLGKFALCKA
jgi:hypothetical protein